MIKIDEWSETWAEHIAPSCFLFVLCALFLGKKIYYFSINVEMRNVCAIELFSKV